MKNVLVLIHDDSGQEARLQAALDIARALGGHLTCVDVVEIMPIVGDYYPAVAEGIKLEEEQERANRDRVQQRLALEDVPWDWVDLKGDIAEALTSAAGLADLIVVNRKLDKAQWPDMFYVAAELALKSGKPVVAVPDTGDRFNLFGSALLAWDGSSEASAALRATVPLLKLASEVLVIEIEDGSIEAPATEAASYLSRHGIRATITLREATAGTTADTLLAEADRVHAAYIVMGAFGRSRFVEAMFGGVSRQMLAESHAPLVIAH
jgi:nucleotide-binding universal stress UspA family protein